MSDNFTKANPQLERDIAACRNSNEIRDVLLHYQELNSLPTKYDRAALPTREWAAPESAEAPKANEKLLRRTFTDNKGVSHEVTGYSLSGLDYLENEIRKRS
jgi:hypothetical protein